MVDTIVAIKVGDYVRLNNGITNPRDKKFRSGHVIRFKKTNKDVAIVRWINLKTPSEVNINDIVKQVGHDYGGDIRELLRPLGFTANTCKADKLWDESGLSIHEKSDDVHYFTEKPKYTVGICANSIGMDFNKDIFHGHNYTEFHYCPKGPWNDWVRLAKKIIEADQKLREAGYVKDKV